MLLVGLETTPSTPPTNLFHLRVCRDPVELLERAIAFSEKRKVFVMPTPRPGRGDYSVMEFSMGQAVGEQPREQWEAWLREVYLA